jgi:hypothetical protein
MQGEVRQLGLVKSVLSKSHSFVQALFARLVLTTVSVFLNWSPDDAQAATAKLYWAQNFDLAELIARADADGENAEALIQSPDVVDPVAVAVDAVGGKIYWAQALFAGDAILRADLDGGNVEIILEWPEVADPVAIAVDGLNGKLYWAQRVEFGDRLMCANLDGSSLETVLQFPAIDAPVALAIDIAAGYIYWAERIPFNDAIKRADLSAPSPQQIVAWPEVDEPIAIAVDPIRGKVYWAQTIFPDRLVRSNFTGTGVETVLEWPEVDGPVAVALDAHDETLYWAQSFEDIIARTSLSGVVLASGATVETLLQWPEVVQAVGIALEPEAEGSSPIAVATGCRYVSITPPPFVEPVAIRVVGDPNDDKVSCVSRFVQAHCTGGSNAGALCSTNVDCPEGNCANSGLIGDTPVYRMPGAWGTVPVRGLEIQPDSAYLFYAVRQDGGNEILSPAATATTFVWGDAVGNGFVSFADVSMVVDSFRGTRSDFITIENTDLMGANCIPQRIINFQDVSATVDAFRGFPFPCDAPCP